MKLKKVKHIHIWKYFGNGTKRVCEAPFPTIESCGRLEKFMDPNWVLIKKGENE